MHLGVQNRNMKIVVNISTLDVGSGNEHLLMKINEYFVQLFYLVNNYCYDKITYY